MKRIGLTVAVLAAALGAARGRECEDFVSGSGAVVLEKTGRETPEWRWDGDEWGFQYATADAASADAWEAAVGRMEAEGRGSVEKREKRGLVLRYGFGAGGEWGAGAVVKDSSGGGHDGRVGGDGLEVVRGIGKRGKAVRFDGKGDYIRVPRDETLEGDEITVAAWVKVREWSATCGGDGIGAVVFKRNTSFHDNEDYCLEIHPGRLLRTDLSSPRGGHVKVTTREGLEPEVWHHVAVVVGGGVARIYVDGELAVEQAYVQSFDHSRTTDLFVGARDHAEHPMGRFGAFDLYELKVWDEVLDGERVAALYREMAGCFGVAKRGAAKGKGKQGPVLRYAFGKGGAWVAGSVVKDLSGQGHDGWVEGDGLEVVDGMGKGRKAARFDGKGDFIRVSRDAAFEGQELSVAAWVRVREVASWENGATIAFKRNSSFNHNEGYCLEIFPDRTVRATVSGPNAAQCRIQSSVPMADGEWHHVAMTHAPGDTRLYVDGALAGQGEFPQEVEHNPEADLLIGGRDHAQYPTDRFGVFDLAEVKVWDKVLGADEMEALYREKAGRPGVGAPGTERASVVEFGSEKRLTWRGIEPPPRVFPKWEPDDVKPDGKPGVGKTGLAAELNALVEQGRRDRAASPEFLAALEGLMKKWERDGRTATDRLPMTEDWRGEGWPLGWEAVRRDVWRFGGGEARQVESRANTRYVLFYESGKEWKDYTVTLKFESDKWFPPPANSCAAVWVRYKGVDDAYTVHFDGNGNVSVISCEQGGKGRVIARTAAGAEVIKDGKPWLVSVRGEEIVVAHEGRRYLEVHDGTHREGTVGVESIHIPMRFGAVEVR